MNGVGRFYVSTFLRSQRGFSFGPAELAANANRFRAGVTVSRGFFRHSRFLSRCTASRSRPPPCPHPQPHPPSVFFHRTSFRYRLHVSIVDFLTGTPNFSVDPVQLDSREYRLLDTVFLSSVSHLRERYHSFDNHTGNVSIVESTGRKVHLFATEQFFTFS